MTDGPPATTAAERDLFAGWARDLLVAVLAVVQSDETPKRAPVHVVFFDHGAQRRVLDGLARNFPAVLDRTPPLYDFLTQVAAYDSPIATFLADEARASRNYPMTCQSLQSVAAYLKFDWNAPHKFREVFRSRLFDYLGKLDVDGESEWYTRRARFGSTIPTEYAYAAWNQLPAPAAGRGDEFADFRAVTKELLVAFQERRLKAMEHIAARIPGNPNTGKTPFALPEIVGYEDAARDLAHALDEFVRIERLVGLAGWKGTRHAPPEQRALAGECLIVSYHEADQDAGVAETNRDNEQRRQRRESFKAAHDAANTGKRIKYPDDCKWSPEGLKVKLRVEAGGVGCDLHELLLLSTIRDGSPVVLLPRWTVDERLPEAQREKFTPTPKQMLYGPRAQLTRVVVTQTDGSGRAIAAVAEVEMRSSRGNQSTLPFVFGAFDRTLAEGEAYTLDPCPNEWYAYWCGKVVEGLCGGSPNVLYDRLVTPPAAGDGEGSAGQHAFLAGLDAFRGAGLLHDFEPGKREFIGGHAATPVLVVQGPPGTGKSYSTAFAVFARLQGAMRDGRDFRTFLSCKTHAATDVLLKNVLYVQQLLRDLRAADRTLFDAHFDPRLLDVPLYRVAPKEPPPGRGHPAGQGRRQAKGRAGQRRRGPGAPVGRRRGHPGWDLWDAQGEVAEDRVRPRTLRPPRPRRGVADEPARGPDGGPATDPGGPGRGRRRPPPDAADRQARLGRRGPADVPPVPDVPQPVRHPAAPGSAPADDPVRRELPPARGDGRVPAAGGVPARRDRVSLAEGRPAGRPRPRRRVRPGRARPGLPAGSGRPRRGREPGPEPVRAGPDRPRSPRPGRPGDVRARPGRRSGRGRPAPGPAGGLAAGVP